MVAPVTVGRYVIFDELAAGGMATVHLGRLLGPVGFARTVAVKRLHPQFSRDPEFVASFLDEARIAARIAHPNVVPTLDVVATSGELFLVMEYVQGESLSTLVRSARRRATPIPIPVSVGILVNALAGLHAAHEATDSNGVPLQIVHRDVSPQNFLVGADGTTRVLDFGIAKASGRSQQTRTGVVKGKLAYMPPEQVQASQIDRRVDIYAASIVLWELLAGCRCFHAENDYAIMSQIFEGVKGPPSSHRPEVSPELDAVIMRACSLDPDSRYATAEAFAQALEDVVAPASPRQVARLVESLAADSLAAKLSKVKEVENSSQFEPEMVNELTSQPSLSFSNAHSSSPSFLSEVRPPSPSSSSLVNPAVPVADITSAGLDADSPRAPTRVPFLVGLGAVLVLASGSGALLAYSLRPASPRSALASSTEPAASTEPTATASVAALPIVTPVDPPVVSASTALSADRPKKPAAPSATAGRDSSGGSTPTTAPARPASTLFNSRH